MSQLTNDLYWGRVEGKKLWLEGREIGSSLEVEPVCRGTTYAVKVIARYGLTEVRVYLSGQVWRRLVNFVEKEVKGGK